MKLSMTTTTTTLVLWPFSTTAWVSRYQNVSILDFIGAEDSGGGGDNWTHKPCKAAVKLSPPTNRHQNETLNDRADFYVHICCLWVLSVSS